MNEPPLPPDPAVAPLWVGLRGLTSLWDRRAAEAAGGAAEAYQRAAAEVQEVLRGLAVWPRQEPGDGGRDEQLALWG